MIQGVIFDLDNTLIDTQVLSSARRCRDWRGCVRRFDETELFSDIADVLQLLRERGISVAVLTTSVSFYAERLLAYHGLAQLPLVHYHSVQPNIKPHPAGVHKAVELMKIKVADCIGVGDQQIDQAAYRAAGIPAMGAGWSPHLEAAPWDQIISTPHQLFASL